MIYVADTVNDCVKVFDNTGKYLSRIGDSTGDGKMNYPHSLAIYENRILISHGIHYWNNRSSILNYQLDGKFLSRIGKHGIADLQFRFPYGLTINQTNGDIYVCDSDNKRIQILSKISNSFLSLEKILYQTLVISSYQKITYMFY